MNKPLKTKICGITQYKDFILAEKLGADYFGFILYDQSPRYISLDKLKEMIGDLPVERCIFVDVMPSEEQLLSYQSIGCERFQVHIKERASNTLYEMYQRNVSSDQLWLAPQIEQLSAFDEALLPFAHSFLIDTYSKSQIGGTGFVGDWSGFKSLKSLYSDKTWILAGGLNPKNVLEAISVSKTNFIDVNSGVESSPGIKDASAMTALFETLKTVVR